TDSIENFFIKNLSFHYKLGEHRKNGRTANGRVSAIAARIGADSSQVASFRQNSSGKTKKPVPKAIASRTGKSACGATSIAAKSGPFAEMPSHFLPNNASARCEILGRRAFCSSHPRRSICPVRIAVGIPASPTLWKRAAGFISVSSVYL
ncbi:MAG: hypothetical protein RRY21_07620, partial [Oscillospiraceae bacterium]